MEDQTMQDDNTDTARVPDDDELEDFPSPNGLDHRPTSDINEPGSVANTDTYQDDLDTEGPDPFTNEMMDDPTNALQVSPDEFKSELDKTAVDDGMGEPENDDMRETIEDRDEDPGDEDSPTGI
jgi:hypothetical protein